MIYSKRGRFNEELRVTGLCQHRFSNKEALIALERKSIILYLFSQTADTKLHSFVDNQCPLTFTGPGVCCKYGNNIGLRPTNPRLSSALEPA